MDEEPTLLREQDRDQAPARAGFVLECWVDVVSENLERYCRLVRRRVRDGNETVHTNKSAEARRFAEQFNLVDGRVDPGVTPGGAAAKNIDRILSNVLGADVLNGQLDSVCAASLHYDADSNIPCGNSRNIGLILLHHGTRVVESNHANFAT